MCITFFHRPACSPDQPFKLVLAMNRDEFLERPTRPAEWNGNLFGGWDQQDGRAGGTWLACNRRGHIAFLTNIYTGGNINKDGKGRGFLVVDYLNGDKSAEEYLSDLAADVSVYNPFNLVLLEPGQDGYRVWEYSRNSLGCTAPHQIKEATYGISNHPPGSQYIKSAKGTEALRNIVAEPKSKEEMLNALEHMLKDSQCNWPDKQIETQSVVGGTAGPFSHCNQSLSSIFVDMPNKGYGTRTHTMILVDQQNNIHYKELTRDNGGWKSTEQLIDTNNLIM